MPMVAAAFHSADRVERSRFRKSQEALAMTTGPHVTDSNFESVNLQVEVGVTVQAFALLDVSSPNSLGVAATLPAIIAAWMGEPIAKKDAVRTLKLV